MIEKHKSKKLGLGFKFDTFRVISHSWNPSLKT